MVSLQRVIGVAIIILALVIGIVPCSTTARPTAMQDTMTDTTMAGGMTATTIGGMGTSTTAGMSATTATTMAGGMTATTTGGMGGSTGTSQAMTAPMPCYYSGKSAVLMAIPLGILGLLLLVSQRKETTRALAVLGIALGAVTMAVPSFVGTCGMATMICNEVLKPTMLLAGG